MLHLQFNHHTMKSQIKVTVLMVIILCSQASAQCTQCEHSTITETPTTICQSEPDKATLHRLYRSASDKHFYTASTSEANKAITTQGYVYNTSPGTVATSSSDCVCGKSLIPVYRLYRAKTTTVNDNHLYTQRLQEALFAASSGYTYEGIAFHCAATANYCGASLPLYRYLRPQTAHFYTTNAQEGNAVGDYEGIVCYIW